MFIRESKPVNEYILSLSPYLCKLGDNNCVVQLDIINSFLELMFMAH